MLDLQAIGRGRQTSEPKIFEAVRIGRAATRGRRRRSGGEWEEDGCRYSIPLRRGSFHIPLVCVTSTKKLARSIPGKGRRIYFDFLLLLRRRWRENKVPRGEVKHDVDAPGCQHSLRTFKTGEVKNRRRLCHWFRG